MYILTDNNGNMTAKSEHVNIIINTWQQQVNSMTSTIFACGGNIQNFCKSLLNWKIHELTTAKAYCLSNDYKITINTTTYKLDINNLNTNIKQVYTCDDNLNEIFVEPAQNTDNEKVICKLNFNLNDVNTANDTDTMFQGTETMINRCIDEHRENTKNEFAKRIESDIAQKKAELLSSKQKLKRQNEQWENFNRKYVIDRNLYFRLKAEGKTTVEEIPRPWIAQWYRFTHMVNNDLLNTNIETINSSNEDEHKFMLQKEIKEYMKLSELYKENNISNPYHGLFESNDVFISKVENYSESDDSTDDSTNCSDESTNYSDDSDYTDTDDYMIPNKPPTVTMNII